MLLSALSFAIMGIFVKLSRRLPVVEIVFARAVISFVISYTTVRWLDIYPWGQQKKLLVARGISGCAGLLLVVYALTHLPLAEATVLQYLHPLSTAALAWLLLQERPSSRFWVSAILGILGTILVAQPAGLPGSSHAAGTIDQLSVLVAVGGALMSSVAYVIVRKLAHSEHPHVIVMYFPMITIPVTFPWVLYSWKTPTTMEWLWLVGVGLATQAGQISLTHGLRALPAAVASTVSYSQVALAAIAGTIFFHEKPTIYTFAGAIVILIAIVLLAQKSKVHERR